ncbi:ABC transporter ATP-binding protein [Rhodococcoides fascians]|uniref:ABC transporter ATP-binding protein n=1 Tax=Rhodococcoides fascians TaxID=1828 RepID=UPI00055AE28C|nr:MULTISPECIES: ATP-binding cassette domain-containing protein [Rhodococcus]OZF03380.1 ABC transporter [Rhodococcus sp. 15-1189-1-1a]OZF17183.1 ABC transporter [Rhodococcus sp. 14-2686-1-2]
MIETTGLTKSFNRGKSTVEAVRGIDLSVAEGELVALLGPNGAGKSTTLRMLTTLLPPTSGSARIAGHSIETDRDAVRRSLGYVGQGNGGGHNQRVRDELITQGLCYGMPKQQAASRADELLSALDLTDLEKRTVGTLSGGQRRRLDIAIGLVHRPPLLFLDEPSTGMDPQSRANLWDHILRLRKEMGTTIVLTTHYLDEADSMAERVVVIDKGTIIADDTADALKAELAGDLVTLSLSASSSSGAAEALTAETLTAEALTAEALTAEALTAVVQGVDGVRDITTSGHRLNIRVARGDRALPELLRRSESRGFSIEAADLSRPTLDDVFLGLTGRSLRENAAV